MSYFTKSFPCVEIFDYAQIQSIFATSKVKDLLFCAYKSNHYTDQVKEVLQQLHENLTITLIIDSFESNNVVKYYTNSNLLISIKHSINPGKKAILFDFSFVDIVKIFTNIKIDSNMEMYKELINFDSITNMQQLYVTILTSEIAFNHLTKQVIFVPKPDQEPHYMLTRDQKQSGSLITKLVSPNSVFQKIYIVEQLTELLSGSLLSNDKRYLKVTKKIKKEMGSKVRLGSTVYIGALVDEMILNCFCDNSRTKPFVIDIPSVFHKNIIDAKWYNDADNLGLLFMAHNCNWHCSKSPMITSYPYNNHSPKNKPFRADSTFFDESSGSDCTELSELDKELDNDLNKEENLDDILNEADKNLDDILNEADENLDDILDEVDVIEDDEPIAEEAKELIIDECQVKDAEIMCPMSTHADNIFIGLESCAMIVVYTYLLDLLWEPVNGQRELSEPVTYFVIGMMWLTLLIQILQTIKTCKKYVTICIGATMVCSGMFMMSKSEYCSVDVACEYISCDMVYDTLYDQWTIFRNFMSPYVIFE